MLLDQADPQLSHRRITGHAGADDAAADDQRIERLRAKLRKTSGTVGIGG